MLIKLDIKNYAIIEDISIEFDKKLNIITGETGAGKSIVIGALSLVLGERIDWIIFEYQQKKCIIESVFDIKDNDYLKDILYKKAISTSSNELILRREINPLSKTSRNFINDSVVTANELGEIANNLIDLHQQFDTLEIYNSAFQFKIIDAVANNFSLLDDYKNIYDKYIIENYVLNDLINSQTQSNKDLEYFKYLLNEFEEINLKQNELEEIDNEVKILNNSESTQLAIFNCSQILTENENSISLLLHQCLMQLKPIYKNNSDIEQLIKRLESSKIELEDLSKDLIKLNSLFNPQPERLNFLNERLNNGYKLLKKHQVKTTNELLNIYINIKEKLEKIQNIDELIINKNKEVEILYNNVLDIADQLHKNREDILETFINKLYLLLNKVGMPNAQFKVNLTKSKINEYGINDIEFLLDANKTNNFKILKKVASGGELNRLMLSLKSIVAKSLKLPTLIFDEIDTGVSGEVAKQIGEILKLLSLDIQIICITHQASIAAKGNKHLFVYKKEINSILHTNIKNLNYQERINQIAEMLSGFPPTENALATAKELLIV